MTTFTPQVHDVISYKLRKDQQPTHPDKVWHGRVIEIQGNIISLYQDTEQEQEQQRHFVVEMIDDGWQGEEDIVYPSQVVSVEHANTSYSTEHKPAL